MITVYNRLTNAAQCAYLVPVGGGSQNFAFAIAGQTSSPQSVDLGTPAPTVTMQILVTASPTSTACTAPYCSPAPRGTITLTPPTTTVSPGRAYDLSLSSEGAYSLTPHLDSPYRS